MWLCASLYVICVCMSECECACKCGCVHVTVCGYVYVTVCGYAYVSVCGYAYVSVWVCICECVWLCICESVWVCICEGVCEGVCESTERRIPSVQQQQQSVCARAFGECTHRTSQSHKHKEKWSRATFRRPDKECVSQLCSWNSQTTQVVLNIPLVSTAHDRTVEEREEKKCREWLNWQ